MQLVSDKSKKMLTSQGVFSEAELQSRFHVRIERYVKVLTIEVHALAQLVDTVVLSTALTYHSRLAKGAASAKAAGLTAPQAEAAERVAHLVSLLITRRKALDAAFSKADAKSSEEAKAEALATDVSHAMLEVRHVCDELEGTVADELWPLPKYREMLFLS